MATDHRNQPEGTVGITDDLVVFGAIDHRYQLEPPVEITDAPYVINHAVDHRYQSEGAVGIFDLGGSREIIEAISDSPVSITGSPAVIKTGSITVTGRPKAYVGTSWQKKPAKVYIGGQWVEKPMKRWDSSSSTWKAIT